MTLLTFKRNVASFVFLALAALLIAVPVRSRAQEILNFPFGVAASPSPDRALGRDPEKTIQRLKELGVKWVRIHWAWKEIEPAEGHMSKEQLERYDGIINRLRQEGFEVVLLLGGVPSWSATGSNAKKKAATKGEIPGDDFLKNVVEFLVTHYKGRVRYYQILNETTLPAHWTEPEVFARQMGVAYGAAKSKDPDCKIIMGGFGTRGKIPKTDYLERFIKAGGAEYADVFDFHMYNYISRFYKEIPELKAVFAKYHITKPIWILETGDPSNFTNEKALKRIGQRDSYHEEGPWDWPTFDEEEQARRVVKRMVLGLSQGIEKIFWYSFQDRSPEDKVDPTRKESGHRNTMGLTYTDFRPKKSFYAYKFLISRLAEARFEKVLDLGDPAARGYLFRQGQDLMAVVWTWSGSKEVVLPLIVKEAAVFDKVGKALGVIKGENERGPRLQLTPDPSYVLIRQ